MKTVQIREIKSPFAGLFTLITYGVFEPRGRKPLYKALTRQDAARWVTEQGWFYLGLQEKP